MRNSIALATALIAITACSGDKAAKAAADSAAAAAAAAATAAAAPTTPPIITITAKDYAYDSPDTVTAGMVTIKLVNQGPSLHHIQLLRLTDGKKVADLEAGLKAAKPGSPPPPWTHDVAGPNAPVPGGGEASITEQLDAGDYAIICFIPDSAGKPHFMNGMIRPLTVVASKTASAPAPTADINVKLTDFAFDVTPALTPGKHIIKIENAAEQSHEMLFAMLAPGKKPADLVAWVGKQVGPPPAKPLGGISGMPKGAVVYMSVDVVPGEYGLFCFLDDVKDHKMHVAHGMLKEISVK